MSDALKPCCVNWKPMLDELIEGGWRVLCYGCMTSVRKPTEAEAIAAWNKREGQP